MPSDQADDCEQFTYTVAAFDPNGRRIFIANIVMPDTDVSIWSLLPKEVDLDLRGALAAVVAEPEPDVYCGIEPVDPGPLGTVLVEATFDDGDPDGGRHTTSDYDAAVGHTTLTPFSVDFDVELDKTYDVVLHKVPSVGNGYMFDGSSESFRIASSVSTFTNHENLGFHDVDAAGYDYTPFPSVGSDKNDFIVNNLSILRELVAGTVLRFKRSEHTADYGPMNLLDVAQPTVVTQADIDAYQAAKATYDQCIADGGLPGEQP